jgi:diguanylate cyclase (GGDEF)-like protein
MSNYEPESVNAGEERQLALIHRVARIATQAHPLRVKLQQIVEVLKEYLGCEFVACASTDAQAGRFLCEALASDMPTDIHVGYSREMGSGVVGEVAATGKALNIADVGAHPNYVETLHGTRSELCVAVRHGGAVIAVLNCESTQHDAFRGATDLLVTVSEQVAGIIAAARLNEEQRQRVQLLGVMSEVSRLAMEGDSLEDTLQRIVGFVRVQFGLVNCALLTFDAERERLIFKALSGDTVFAARCGEEWPLGLGVVGRALRTGEAQFVPDVSTDPDYVMGDPAVAAELLLPIRFHGKLLGLLNLEGSSAEQFSEAHRQILFALTEQVAGAIHLAATNQRLRDTNRLVEEKSIALLQANARLREMNVQLERLSNLDGLTGIANRRRFDETLRLEWQRAQRHRHTLSLLMIDIDDFKAYNDGYGHLAGDDALRRVAASLAAALQRSEDLLARYGGEEFAVLLPETPADEAERCGWHLHSAAASLGLPHRYSRAASFLSISIGVASIVPTDADRSADFIDRADRALYQAKQRGRNRVESWRAA